jgi:uncharacterized iron-regulated membrane protein
MNNTNNYLHDIELPSASLPDFILVLLVLIALFLLGIMGRYYYQQQRPIARAKRQLRLLASTQANPQALATLLQQSLQVQRLSESALPEDFLQRLDQARFAAYPCDLETFMQLKDEAQRFMEQQQ